MYAKKRNILVCLATLSAWVCLAPAATIQVGPGRTYTTVQAGYSAAAAGDTIAEAAMTFTVTVNDGKGGQANDSVNVRVRMLGDVNQDDGVDVLDLLILVDAFGSVKGDPDYDPACDFNHDDGVDVIDLLDFVANFGRTLE